MSSAGETSTTGELKGHFDTTHWSLVLLAGQGGAPEADAALASLCKTYWYPLYVFVRRLGQGPEDAQDLVQGFFARFLQKEYFKDADREKGRFRSFLLMALKRFMADEWDRANCRKRGGGHAPFSLDARDTKNRFRAEAVDELSPEKAYDRHWAKTLLEQVSKGLEAEYCASGKGSQFEGLSRYLSGEERSISYAEMGERLGMSEGNVKVSVYRLRQRYRELLRLEIGKTVDSPESIDDEIRELFAALA